MLFNPHFGKSLQPLHETHKHFLALLAVVFAQFELIPKNHPGLEDPRKLSFIGLLVSAWLGLKFDREGLPKVAMFFVILGMMALSLMSAAGAILSVLIGTAHAQTTGSTSSYFTPETQDIAQAWIDYLFNGVSLPNYYDQMGNAIPSNFGLQQAFTTVLGFYSDAMLIVAAIILFYHLTAMVAETAHHGTPLGKRASQIWAPIRLVVAIGLLVPVGAAGLNCGQYIVVKIAELGSGMASTAWTTFLQAIANYAPAAIAPNSPVITQAAMDALATEACIYDYNTRLNALGGPQGIDMSNAVINPITVQNTQIGGHIGTKTSFSSNDLPGQDICGWYFLPTVPSGADAATTAAYQAQASAFNAALSNFATDAQSIKYLIPQTDGGSGGQGPLQLDQATLNDVIAYQTSLSDSMANLAGSMQSQTTQAVDTLTPYGWVAAGALLPMVARTQAMVSNAVSEGLPGTHPPDLVAPTDAPSAGLFGGWFGNPSQKQLDEVWDVRKSVAEDLRNYGDYLTKSWAQEQSTNAQCAAMLGLQDEGQGGAGAWIVDFVFTKIDWLATKTGIWTSTSGQPCASSANTPSTFKVGINQLAGGDPLAQMTKLGHSCIDVAFILLAIALAGKLGAAAASAAGAAFGTIAAPGLGTVIGVAAGLGISAAFSAAAPLFDFAAVVFLACGFVLAYVLPMFPFTRFFFAVLSWVASLIEAIVAMPLVALAHLTVEGEGLPGQAKQGYFFIFSLFLRPILCVFGLVAGLLMFLIAVNFVTFIYNLGVAASGGTAYGHAAMGKMVYTVLYVALLYICANHSFALIDHIPKNAMSWLGASGPALPEMGNAQHMAQFESLVATYAGQQVLSNISQATGRLGEGMSNATKGGAEQWSKKLKNDKDIVDKTDTATLATRRHTSLIAAIRGEPEPHPDPVLRPGDDGPNNPPDNQGPPSPSGEGRPPTRTS